MKKQEFCAVIYSPESGKSWRPMLQGGRGVKSYIWVYARLHSDGNITLFTGNQVSE